MIIKDRELGFVDAVYCFFLFKFIGIIIAVIIMGLFIKGAWLWYLFTYALWCGILALYIRIRIGEKYIEGILKELNKLNKKKELK